MASLPNIIKGLWPSKIRTQLICGVALVHLLLMTFFIFDLVGRQRDFLGQQSLEQTTSLAETLALNSSSWVLANDVVGLEEIVLAVGKYPGLRYAMVITTDGEVLAHTDKSRLGQHLADEKSRALLSAKPKIQIVHADQNILDVAAPILTNNGNITGWARIAQGREKIADNLVIISRNGILYTLMAIVAGSLFAILLGNRLTSDLNRLIIVARQVRDGRRDLRMKISRQDEVALLGEGFNKMLDAIVANENLILLNQLRLESLANIFQFQAANKQELLDYTLEQAINLTDSRFGYISYYDEEKQEFTLNSWSREVMPECAIVGTPTCYQLDKTGLWGEAVRQRKPILVNDFQAENPLKKGYPQGHAELYNYLTIPVFQKTRIVAVVAVANKEEDYNQGDIIRLTLLMDAVWKLVDRKHAKEALYQSEQSLKEAQRIAHMGNWNLDLTTNELHWSDEIYRIFEIDANELGPSYEAILKTIHPDDREAVKLAYTESLRNKRPYEITHRVLMKDGRVKHVHERGQTFYDSADRPLRSIGTVQDITERKQVEQVLEQAAREWSAAMDASDDVIYLLNLQLHIVRANKAFYLATGTTPETAIGRHIVEVIHPQGEAVPCPVCCAQEDKRDLQIVMEAEHPDNPVERPLEITVKIVRDQEEHPISILMTLHDLSASRKEMEEKTTLERQLQQAQKMESVGRLAGGVAHDFNNMLGVIIGHTEIAMNQVDPDQPLHASLAEIHKAAQRSADLTRQLLAFARKQTVAPKVLDLNETVAGMLNMLHRIIGENIILNWQPGANLWLIKVDPSQIDQILANLCINARDAIADVGKLSIETGNRTLDDTCCATHPGCVPGEYVLLTVSDSGCGMDKATLAQIFEPFFTTKDIVAGTGLGLATVYGAVKQNNGFINAYSEPGQGTTFTIYLPRYTGQAKHARTEGVAEPAMGGQETILLVEDEPAILQMTRIMLAGLGYAVLAASTPAEAIRLAREHTGEIRLLMTDVVMPEINGRDLAEKLLSLDPHLKSLFMSGYTADIIAHHGILDERAHFLQKPFSTNDLAIKVREALNSE